MQFRFKHTLIAAILGAVPLSAHAADADNTPLEPAVLPSPRDVTLLNKGGKYVAIDMKKLAEGDKCHLEKDAIIVRVGTGAEPETTRVRYAVPNFSHGGCPFMTEFDLPNADYAAGRAAFVAKQDEATAKFNELKKTAGDKWNELMQQKPAEPEQK
jgi:hypothetical protein